MNTDAIAQTLARLGPTTHVFLCGPPAMVDVSHATLSRLGVGEERIFYERWW
jgi:ferredoxin-NADP reductase